MRILLITDTHGDLATIDDLIERERADACIHCGDFGFYDADSVERLSERELRLRLVHSPLPRERRREAWKLPLDELRRTVRETGLLGGLAPYLAGEARFAAPVYAVWGNHEDADVVRALRDGRASVGNLHLLDDRTAHQLAPWLRVIGLGGNFWLDDDPALFAPAFTGRGGTVRASWVEYARLLDRESRWRERTADEPPAFTILVGHVSPGKAQLLERLALVLGVDMAVCGHMDPPVSHAYSLFAVCEPDRALARSELDFARLRALWSRLLETPDAAALLDDETRALVERSLAALDLPAFPVRGRGSRAAPGTVEDRYYTTQFVNVGDAPTSWSVLDIDPDGAVLTHRSSWRRPSHVGAVTR